MVECAKNRCIGCIGLTLFTTVFLQKSLIYIDFDRWSGKQKSILTGGPGRNTKRFEKGSEPNQSPQPDQPCPRMLVPSYPKLDARKYFPYLATKQRPDETIRARHRSAILRAHSMGLRNYPSRQYQIPPQMGRTHFPPFSETCQVFWIPEPLSSLWYEGTMVRGLKSGLLMIAVGGTEQAPKSVAYI